MATAVGEQVHTDVAPPMIPTTPTASPPQVRRKWFRWAILAGIVIVLAVSLELWRSHAQNAVHFDTVMVERGAVQASITATGTLNAVVDVQVGSQVSGNIKTLYADFNTKVAKGQLVAQIDPEMFQAQVDQATATVGAAHSAALAAAATVQKSMADHSGAIASEKNVESILAKDKATAVNANNQYQRLAGLFKDLVTSRQDYDASKAVADAASAQVVADQAQIDAAAQTIQSAQAQVLVAQAQWSSSQAQEKQAQATLQQQKINLDHTRITAPVDGTVIARRMDVGQTVAASFASPTIFEIAQDLTKMQLDTSVDESDIGTISAGQSASFTVDAYPGTTFTGQVAEVRKAPITAQNVVTYDVVISVANPDFKLFPGMTANARILTARLEDTVKVPNAVLRVHPSAAILSQAGVPPAKSGAQNIYVVSNGKLKGVAVIYGLSDGKSTAVIKGDLQAGEQVVVRFTTAANAPAASSLSAPGATTGGRKGQGF